MLLLFILNLNNCSAFMFMAKTVLIKIMENNTKQDTIEVTGRRDLTQSTYILELKRDNIDFTAGQFICLGVKESLQMREYSIYSGENELNLEVIIKEIEGGFVSQKLKRCQVGEWLRFKKPYGQFTLNHDDIDKKKYFFIATGTGIAPFHSYIRSYENLNYQVLHGVRYNEEVYDYEHYLKERYTVCTTQEDNGYFHGRVTDYLKQNPQQEEFEYYLCGNGKMIYEVIAILRNQNIPTERIHFEVFF